MKIYEIVAEDREQLNEIAPLAALGGWAAIMGAVSAFLTALSIYDIYQILKKHDYNVDNLTADDYGDLFIDVLMLSVPGAGKFARSTIAKFMPASAKKAGGEYMKKFLAPKMSALKAEYKAAGKAGTKTARTAGQTAAITKYKAAAEALYDKKIIEPAKQLLGAAAVTPMIIDYYEKISELEDQYNAVLNGDTSTKLFGGMSKEEAYRAAAEKRKQYIGELSIAIGAAIASVPASKLVNFIGSGAGKLVSVGGSIPLIGGLVKLPFSAAAKLISLGGPAIPLFMQTDAGQKFLASNIIKGITELTGSVVAVGLDLFNAAVEEVAKRLGVDATPVTDITKSKIQKPAGMGAEFDPNSAISKIPPQLRITRNPSNPKIMYIGGVQVTDATGKRTAGDSLIKQFQLSAAAADVPDPTAEIGK